MAPNQSAIKRFTYDWLIRYAELHPFEIPKYQIINEYKHDPLTTSKYAQISPLFATLLTRYMPYIIYVDAVVIKNGQVRRHSSSTLTLIQQYNLGAYKKPIVYISRSCIFEDVNPDMIQWFKNNNVTFYGKGLYIESDRNYAQNKVTLKLTPDVLMFMLKQCYYDTEISMEAHLTEPLLASSVLPLISHCTEFIAFRMKNIIFDENCLSVFHENPVRAKTMHFVELDITDRAFFEMLKSILSSPVCPCTMHFHFMQEKNESFGKTVLEICGCVGTSEFYYETQPDRPFNDICLYEEYGSILVELSLTTEVYLA